MSSSYALDPELEQEYGNGIAVNAGLYEDRVHDLLEYNMWQSVSHICAREGKGAWTVIPRMYEAGEGPWADRFSGNPYWYGVYRPTRLLDALLAKLDAKANDGM